MVQNEPEGQVKDFSKDWEWEPGDLVPNDAAELHIMVRRVAKRLCGFAGLAGRFPQSTGLNVDPLIRILCGKFLSSVMLWNGSAGRGRRRNEAVDAGLAEGVSEESIPASGGVVRFPDPA